VRNQPPAGPRRKLQACIWPLSLSFLCLLYYYTNFFKKVFSAQNVNPAQSWYSIHAARRSTAPISAGPRWLYCIQKKKPPTVAAVNGFE
jgi:hypothetical protein